MMVVAAFGMVQATPCRLSNWYWSGTKLERSGRSSLCHVSICRLWWDAATGDWRLLPDRQPQNGRQIHGTCSSYYTPSSARHIVAPDGAELLWLPLGAPLMIPSAIDYKRWEIELWTRGPLVLHYRFISRVRRIL
jgi:hypothetical protein